MALRIDPPITEDEARKMLADWRNTPAGAHRSWLWDMIQRAQEPTPHIVNYRAGRVYYHAPHHFPLLPRDRSPSDCTWIVPGTERWT